MREHETLIRPYARADHDPLLAIARELQAHEHGIFERMKPPGDIGAWYIEHLLRQCAESAGQILVLEHRGTLAGYATILTAVRCDEADETAYNYALIGDLAVAAGMRGRGFGRLLINECERLARQSGARWLRVYVLARNTNAVKLYRQSGLLDHLLELEKPLSGD